DHLASCIMPHVHRASFIFSAAIVATVLSFGLNARAAEPAGFAYSLFDGQSLRGWTVENDAKIVVEDGLLVLKDGNGWLRSDHTYGDFTLHVEWKALKAADYDSGIYIRAGGEGAPFPKAAHQVNLLQGKEGNIGN